MTIKNATQAPIAPPTTEPIQSTTITAQPETSQATNSGAVMAPTTSIDSGADNSSDTVWGMPRQMVEDRVRTDRIDNALTGNISPRDVENVHATLDGVGSRNYAGELGNMESSGTLDRYIGNMDSSQRESFALQLERNGMTQTEPGQRATGSFDPPDAPDFIVASENAPAPVREFVMEQNLNLAEGYAQEYREYSERYVGEVQEAESMGEVCNVVGYPQESFDLIPPGLSRDEQIEFVTNLDLYERPEAAAISALGDARRELTGEDPMGTFSVNVHASASLFGHELGQVGDSAIDMEMVNIGNVGVALGEDGSAAASVTVGSTTVSNQWNNSTGDLSLEVEQQLGSDGTNVTLGGGITARLTTGDGINDALNDMCADY